MPHISLLALKYLFVMNICMFCSNLVHASMSLNTPVKKCKTWALWDDFKQNFITQDGRVIDLQSKNYISTSEGQSYALFFSLIANDKIMFKKLLAWSQNNLAYGNLNNHLPAWVWGLKKDKRYGIIDKNPATDADLWLAYTLIEAGRLWQNKPYKALGLQLLKQIISKETEHIPGLGLSLLPAPYGFKLDHNIWRLNPSYLPLPILKRFSIKPGFATWKNIYKTSAKTILHTSIKGFSPDWVLYSKNKTFHYSIKNTDLGSYDAIRVYLWAGLMNEKAEYKTQLLKQLSPMVNSTKALGSVPLNTYANTGKYKKKASSGFMAALLPLLKNTHNHFFYQQEYQNLQIALLEKPNKNYYQSVLMLFSLSFIDGLYHFDKNGFLFTHWNNQNCVSI
ncbi:cellulose synthase complex periplasmic endoglucanase BcsZ [Pseudoalteromonas denitrificans]|uniref:cellulase n=1 Tax=Pseudoalteromonas denitrificans DSM 6059 TaxID=1123010 RepID=A0A1I1LGJ9_9GAMM|nr:cellulose synthase complex periplasmic endoglucanase BcsZ [Pseudoalteromonas denitrificans]SFC72224.1 endoglucanase [Pseudoalteromonas denitrificans DSM 6059]